MASEFGMEVWVVEGLQIQSNQFTDFPLIYVIDFWLLQKHMRAIVPGIRLFLKIQQQIIIL